MLFSFRKLFIQKIFVPCCQARSEDGENGLVFCRTLNGRVLPVGQEVTSLAKLWARESSGVNMFHFFVSKSSMANQMKGSVLPYGEKKVKKVKKNGSYSFI